MNRFITTALAALAITALAQESPQPRERSVEPGQLRKAPAPTIIRVNRPGGIPLQQAIEAFRRGWTDTDPTGQPPHRWASAEPGQQLAPPIGCSLSSGQLQAIARAMAGAPAETQRSVWYLYGANQHLWRELQRLTAAQWDGPNDEPPPGGEADEPPGDGNDNGGGDPPAESVVYRINCGGPALDGWTDDRLFVGGGTFQAERYAGIYRTERFGAPVRYSLPVTPGRYTVRLHMAELFWTGQAGRTFDVSLEGAIVLDDFAPEPSAGTIVREFAVEVTDGALDIVATPSRDNASLCGLEVVR